MRNARRWFVVVISSVVAVVVTGATTSVATAGQASKRPSPYAPSMLILTLTHGERAEPVRRATMLRCLPHGGDHPAPRAACRALASADGDFTAIPPRGGICTLEYRPVTVTARGVWQGRLVTREATYGNYCALRAATGPVFSF